MGEKKKPTSHELRQTESVYSPVLQKGNHQENGTFQAAGLPVLPTLPVNSYNVKKTQHYGLN
jgi:hypothetical protein